MDVRTLIDKEKLVKWRRHFHMYPEVSFEEHETTDYILEQLAKYPEIEVFRPAKTGVVAVLKGGKSGKTIGLRADIDALPIVEEADVEFKSKNHGVMHACGHDMHTAMLLGAVDALYKIKDRLCGTVKFIFQHAEELLPGGAAEIVKSGLLDDVEMFYGSHVNSYLPTGTIGGAIGPIYANTDSFTINIQGKGAHAAAPHVGIDSLLIGTEVVQALNFIVSRNVPPSEPAVLTVACFNAGTTHNIIPDTATIKGTVRSYSPEVRELIERRFKETVNGICAAYGATCHINYARGYACVDNDEGLYHMFMDMMPKFLPDVNVGAIKPIMGGEDFSAYATIAPAFFGSVGAAPYDDTKFSAHHPKFIVNEDALPIGCAVYVAFALEATGS